MGRAGPTTTFASPTEVGAARGRGFVAAAVEAGAGVALFVALGLVWGAALEATRPPISIYPPSMDRPESPTTRPEAPLPGRSDPPLWLVDGYNVVNVALLAGRSREGWWRPSARRELLERVARFDDPSARLWVVFDGPDAAAPAPGRARAVFAPSADEWLLARLREASEPARIRLVTADRRLAARARRRGASVVAPASFLARCPGSDAERG